jgi:replicative DNA helicase
LSTEDKSNETIQMSKAVDSFLEDLYSESRIIKTFSDGLNLNLFGGLHPGMLFSIEGAPNGSKSTLAQQIIEKAAEEFHYPGLFILSELTPMDLYTKSISRLSRKSSTLIKSKAWETDQENNTTLKTSIDDANELYLRYAECLYVEDYSKRVLTLQQIEKHVTTLRDRIRRDRNVTDDPPFTLFIESIQRIHYKSEECVERGREIDRITHDLKKIAEDHGITIIGLYDLPAFPMLYENHEPYYSSPHRSSLGDTAQSASVAAYIEMGDWLLDIAIKDFSHKGIDAFTRKLEDTKRHFPLTNPKIKPYSPTYARMLFSHKTAGVAEQLFFIYLQATNEFLEITV